MHKVTYVDTVFHFLGLSLMIRESSIIALKFRTEFIAEKLQLRTSKLVV
jgi:hypothetical protein